MLAFQDFIQSEDGNSAFVDTQGILQAPPNPPSVSAAMDTPPEISSCARLILDGSRSQGGAGRRMHIAFRVTHAVPAFDFAALNSNLMARAQFQNSPRLLLMNRFLPPNTTLTLEMLATSWLNVTDTAQSVVRKSALELPSFVSAATTFETQRVEELVVDATAEHECATAVELKYSWTQVSGPTYYLSHTNREKVLHFGFFGSLSSFHL